MPRRWIAALACLAALVALACDGSGSASPRPSGSTRPGDPRVLTALGDSVTTGFGSCLVLVSCERNSWSTGDSLRVESLFRRLRGDVPALRANNRAVPGARAAGLADQARSAVRDKADLVTVLIGANDVCRGDVDAMTPTATFREQVDTALAVLRKGRPKARVLVVSIPDLYRLWAIGHTEKRAVRAWSRGVCPALLADADVHRARRDGPPGPRPGPDRGVRRAAPRRLPGVRVALPVGRRRGAPPPVQPGPGKRARLVPPERGRSGPVGRGGLERLRLGPRLNPARPSAAGHGRTDQGWRGPGICRPVPR